MLNKFIERKFVKSLKNACTHADTRSSEGAVIYCYYLCGVFSYVHAPACLYRRALKEVYFGSAEGGEFEMILYRQSLQNENDVSPTYGYIVHVGTYMHVYSIHSAHLFTFHTQTLFGFSLSMFINRN